MYYFFLILRRPPRSTRTDTLFPYTTLCRSAHCFNTAAPAFASWTRAGPPALQTEWKIRVVSTPPERVFIGDLRHSRLCLLFIRDWSARGCRHSCGGRHQAAVRAHPKGRSRSEEGRVGKEGVSTVRYRWER